MLKYILKRFLYMIPVLFIISILLFGISKSMPGDPALLMLPPGLKDEQAKEMLYNQAREKLGLDKPIVEQYFRWVGNTLTGDFGYSSQFKRPVKELLGTPLKNTIVVNIFAVTISFVLSVIIGIKSAVRKGTAFDQFWQVTTLLFMSIPIFFIGLGLIYIFALKLRWLPAGGMPLQTNDGSIQYYLSFGRHITLMVATLTIGGLASITRYVRNGMIHALSQDYVRTARSKGLSQKVVIYRHAFRNSMTTIVTLVVGAVLGIFGGTAITESVFAYNGIGYYFITAVSNRDYAIMLTMNMMYVVIGLLGNLIMDIGYTLVDPRVKYD